MPSTLCVNVDCTIAETGTCLLHSSVSECPHYTGDRSEPDSDSVPSLPEQIPVDDLQTTRGRQFHSSLELGTADSTRISLKNYAHLIAILGSYNVGKTCLLSSLYLLSSHADGLHTGVQFAGSLTLQGFEARCRRLRSWQSGVLPEQLADHTQLEDPRSPSLLHLSLKEKDAPRRRLELLLTDLPGEWTDQLIDRLNTSHRFSFLRRADGIIVVVDGTLLERSSTRNAHIHRYKLLFDRLATSLNVDRTLPVVMAVSKCDEITGDASASAKPILDHALSHGFNCHLVPLCALSRSPNITPNGQGVWDSIAHIVYHPPARTELRVNQHASERAFSRFEYSVGVRK